MAQLTPEERDQARQRVGTATAALAILAVGGAGAVSILAWHATTEASAATSTRNTSPNWRNQGQLQGDEQAEGQRDDDQGQQGGGWSGVPGNGLPGGGIQGANPPGQGSGGGSVRSQGS